MDDNDYSKLLECRFIDINYMVSNLSFLEANQESSFCCFTHLPHFLGYPLQLLDPRVREDDISLLGNIGECELFGVGSVRMGDMADFNRNKRSFGPRRFDKPGFDRGPQQMHKAVCSNCGKDCEVPFRPTGSKPVLCRDCFKSNPPADSRGSDSRSFGRPQTQSSDRQMYDANCSSCGTSCKVPFRPTAGKDVFCSRCFEHKQGVESGRFENKPFASAKSSFTARQSPTSTPHNFTQQMDALHTKMDKILHLLANMKEADAKVEVVSDESKEAKVESTEDKPKKITSETKKKTVKRKKSSKSNP